MVTGIKTAYPGARLDRTEGSEMAIAGDSQISGPAGFGNAGAGGHAQHSASELETLALTPLKPFVYGYRLRECYYTVLGPRHREYVDGALFGVGSETAPPMKESEEEEMEIEFDGIDDEDLRDWEVEGGVGEYQVVPVVDECDGSTCDVILPIRD
ncbi:hypothetical protein F4777DRAFT_556522 [Nemania sp. FL0916]|nr:hypothetical protein F4777DRAFT_556522 [Nemania sp. FL0916]